MDDNFHDDNTIHELHMSEKDTQIKAANKPASFLKKRKRIGIKNRKSGKAVRSILKNEQDAPTCNVSQEEIGRTLKFFENYKSSRDIYKEKCVASIHFEKRNAKIDTGYFVNLLELARKCLIQKNWSGLARVLICAKPLTRSDYSLYFSVFLTYASICLLYNPDKELMDVFLEGVLMCNSEEEKHNILRSILCLKNN